MQPYVTWTPEYDGHRPPYWRERMSVTLSGNWDYTFNPKSLHWHKGQSYLVERAAVDPDTTALIAQLRKLPADELAKHGVTLEPEKDWAVEFFVDVYRICNGNSYDLCGFDEHDLKAIEYIRNNARPLI